MMVAGGMEELATDWRDFYSQSATDTWFKKQYQEAYDRMDYERIARLLSGRLRQMEKRAKAANQRADKLQGDLEALQAHVQWMEGRE